MTDYHKDKVLTKLKERAKELKCLYDIENILKDHDSPVETIFSPVIDKIPQGWMHPTVCEVLITFEGQEYYSEDLVKTKWFQKADILIDGNYSGEIRVFYTLNIGEKEDPFLPDEQRLLNTIADRISMYIFQRKLKKTIDYLILNEPADNEILNVQSDEHWRWREKAVQEIAERFDLDRFQSEGLYLIGSTRSAKAGPGSDIDLIVHFRGDENTRKELVAWMEGWGLCLSLENFHRTGYKVQGSLIDLHIVTDKDILEKNVFASMIGRKEEGAKPVKVKA